MMTWAAGWDLREGADWIPPKASSSDITPLLWNILGYTALS